MKKVFLIAAIAAVSFGAKAQVTFGVQVGGNMANLKIESTDAGVTTEEDTESKFGFLIGGIAEIPLASSLSFRPELNFIQKGAKMEMSESGVKFESKSTLNFIEIPLNVVYKVPAGAGSVFFGAGPNIGFGISGKLEQTISGAGAPFDGTTESDVKFDGKKYEDQDANDMDYHLKSLDFGANLLAGYKMSNGMFINLGYTMGFSNLEPNTDESFKTKGFTIKLGYMFGGSAPKED